MKVRHTYPSKIGEVVVAFPSSVDEQRSIVSMLVELNEETQRLEAIYQQKLAGLDELKNPCYTKPSTANFKVGGNP